MDATNEEVDVLLIRGFFGDQCIWCKNFLPIADKVIGSEFDLQMLKHEFTSPVHYLSADFTLLEEFNVDSFPLLVAFNAQQQECSRLVGFVHEEELKNWINELELSCNYKSCKS